MVHKQSESTKPLRRSNKENRNVPHIKKKNIKTYGKLTAKNSNIENNFQERTLEPDLWKDSFDRLLDSVSSLRAKIKPKKVVRASFNQDSSIDLSRPKENQLNNISYKNEKKKKNKNNITRNDERSPFNLEKSLAAINYKMKKKPAAIRKKQKNQNIKPIKNTQLYKFKGKSVASTPLRAKKIDNFLNSCIISPIKSKPSKSRHILPLFNTNDVNQKLILNYTDSIEEARNISKLNNNTNSNKFSKDLSKYSNKNLYENELQNKQQCSLEQYNQAGLELNNDEKIKYVLNYINKLPSNYEKYNFSGVSNMDCNSNTKLSRTLSFDASIASRSNNENSCDISLLRICDKICNSNPIPNYNDDIIIQRDNMAFPNISIISLNSTTPHRESLNNNDQIPKLIECSFQENIENNTNISKTNPIDSIIELPFQLSNKLDNELSIVDKNNRAFANKLTFLRNCQMLNADSNNFHKRLSCLYDNKPKKKLLRRHTIELDKINRQLNIEISYDPCNNLNSNHDITDGEGKKRIVERRNKSNYKKISDYITRRRPHTLNNNKNNKISSINGFNSKSAIENSSNNENIELEQHQQDKVSISKIKLNNQIQIMSPEINLKKFDEDCDIIPVTPLVSAITRYQKLTRESRKKIVERRNEKNYKKLSDNITRRRPHTLNNTKNNRISLINCFNSKSAIENSCNNEIIELEQHQQEVFSKTKLNNEIQIMSPEINLKRFDEDCDIIIPGTPLVSAITRYQKLTTTSTKIGENCSDGNSIIYLSDDTTDMVLTQNRKKLPKSLLDSIFDSKQSKVNHSTEKELISSSMDKIKSHEDSQIISGTRSRILITTSKTVENFTSEDEVINSNEGISNVKETKHKSIGNRKRQGNFLLDNNKFPNKQKKTTSEDKEPTVSYQKEFKSRKCKIILKKNNSINKITSKAKEFDADNEIIPATPPLTTVKPLIRNRILTTTSTKIVENSSGENSIIDLSNRYQYYMITQNREKLTKSLLDGDKLSNKHKKICFEGQQPEVDNKSAKELVINEEFSNMGATKLKSIENRKRHGKSLLNNNKFPNKQKKITSEDKKSTVRCQQNHFKPKKCKIILKRLPQSKANIGGSNVFNQIILTDDLTNNKDNSQVLLDISNICSLDNNYTNKKRNSNFNVISNMQKKVSFSNKTKMTIIPPSNKSSVGAKMSAVENDCSVIEISFDKNEDMKSSTNAINRSTELNTRKNYSSTVQHIQEEPIIYVDKEIENLTENILNTTEKLTLPPGKWRRTLINWKKNQSVIDLDESQIPVVLGKNTTINLEKTITDNKYKLMPKISSSYKPNTIISDQLIDKELKTQILPVQRILRNNERKTCLDSSLIIISENPEAECKSIEKRQTGVRKTLLLEPTDDGTPNFTTCSLFNTFTKPKAAAETIFVSNRQHSKNSKRFIEIEEEDFNDLQQKDDQQLQQQNQKQYHNCEEGYSDEIWCNNTITNNNKNSNNNKQKYQHQISVPICGTTKQSSILSTTIQRGRRGRTSIIETTNNIGFEQLSSSSAFTGSGDYHHHHHNSNREFIHSLLLNDDEQNILLCPSLNVSIRALLSPRDIVLRRCGQTDPYDFSIIYSETELRQCRKIGEGVYGEVYMNKNRNGEAIVLKIIPIDGQIEINGEQQKNFDQILPEIIIAAELSRLRNDKNFMTSGFVEVKNVHCVQGRYPQHLIDLWELYRDNCGTENDHPEIFQDDQLFIVLELANGGQDLEAFQFQNGLQSNSAFFQTALSLAVAERKFKFEHRDLHWGNILLAPTDEKEINFKFNDKIISIPTHGVKVTIIDYTLSRMNFEGCCLYNDLSNDNELFTASGDYQFDIYRLMQKNLENQWERYDPYTNILWLHYTIDKMISGARYRSSKTKKHRSAIQDMMVLRDELLDYKSASDYVECLDLYIKKNY